MYISLNPSIPEGSFLNTESLLLLVRALLLGISFTGLCEAARTRLNLDRFIAPFIAACTVIVVLMLTGMAGFLQAGFFVLYAAGFAGLIYTWLICRMRPAFGVIGLLAVYAALLCVRFINCPLYHVDDFSHWGLVARTVLDHNAFPSAATPSITFQSYPTGTASFIYYVCRTLGNREDLYVVAQLFLTGLAFLPLLAHIRAGRRYLYPVALVFFLFLLQRNHIAVSLRVDWLLPFLGVGGIASVLHYRSDLKKALPIALISAAVCVYIKSSGMFFSVWIIAALAWAARRRGVRGRRLAGLILTGTSVFIAAYLLWALRVKLAYPAGFESKHAVSLSNYAAELMHKGVAMSLQIAGAMISFLLHPNIHAVTGYGMFIAIAAVLIAGCLLIPGQRPHLKPVLGQLAVIAGSYLLWFVLLFGMYLFSMPEGEALELASIDRYNSTGLLFMMSLASLRLFAFYGREDIAVTGAVRRAYCVGAACCIAGMALLFVISNSMHKWYLSKDTRLLPVRQRLIEVKEAFQLPDNSRVLFFCVNEAEDREPFLSFYHAKYELRTRDVVELVSGTLEGSDDILYARYRHGQELEWLDDPVTFVAGEIDGCDAFVLIDYEPEFDAQIRAFLETYEGSTPVVFAYP